MMAKSILSSVPDSRCTDSRWVALELEKLMKTDEEKMTRDITLRALKTWLQTMHWDTTIALFSEYANNDDLATIDERDVLAELDWKQPNPNKLGYWRAWREARCKQQPAAASRKTPLRCQDESCRQLHPPVFKGVTYEVGNQLDRTSSESVSSNGAFVIIRWICHHCSTSSSQQLGH